MGNRTTSGKSGYRYRLLLSGALIVLSYHAMAVQLSDFLWQNRPLLLFAPSGSDDRLQQTQRVLLQRQCELEDRDMVIGIIAGPAESRLNGQSISPDQAMALRQRYKIAPGQFTAILIGKDGGQKERVYTTPDLNDLFALIDGMPMRQDEMLANPDHCHRSYDVRPAPSRDD